MQTQKREICVFCGASPSKRGSLTTAIEAFADGLVARDWGLVYGGGRVGLMGTVADRVLVGGGRVFGVIPHQLSAREQAHRGLTELVEVETMHERKALMYDRSDAFVGFPGGFGTLDEMMEIVTWKQLSIHSKPVIFANIDGYYDALAAWTERAELDGLLRPEVRALATFANDIDDVFACLEAAAPGPDRKMNWA
jgi:uncharacterized protein (TIGR00730 family)